VVVKVPPHWNMCGNGSNRHPFHRRAVLNRELNSDISDFAILAPCVCITEYRNLISDEMLLPSIWADVLLIIFFGFFLTLQDIWYSIWLFVRKEWTTDRIFMKFGTREFHWKCFPYIGSFCQTRIKLTPITYVYRLTGAFAFYQTYFI
jgi:hypothetical protein